MGLIKNLKDFYALKKHMDNGDYSDDPRGFLEETRQTFLRNPNLDKQIKFIKTYDIVCEAEKIAEKKGWVRACQEVMPKFGVKYNLVGKENVPDNGSSIYISNHIYGLLDSLFLVGGLGGFLKEKNKEFKILAAHKLKVIKGLEEILLFLDLSVKDKNDFRKTPIDSNLSSIRKTLKYLDKWGGIAIFPAGQTSDRNLKDYPWKPTLGKLVKYCDQIVPMWFSGPKHGFFHKSLCLIDPRLRDIAAFDEAWNKKGKTITLNIGKPFSREYLEKLNFNNGDLTNYLRKEAEKLRLF